MVNSAGRLHPTSALNLDPSDCGLVLRLNAMGTFVTDQERHVHEGHRRRPYHPDRVHVDLDWNPGYTAYATN